MFPHACIARTLLNLNKVVFSVCERVYVHEPSVQEAEEDTRCLRVSTTGICRMSDLFLDSGIRILILMAAWQSLVATGASLQPSIAM